MSIRSRISSKHEHTVFRSFGIVRAQLHKAVCSEELPVTLHSSSKIKPSSSLPTETRYSFSPSNTAHAAKDIARYSSWKDSNIIWRCKCLFTILHHPNGAQCMVYDSEDTSATARVPLKYLGSMKIVLAMLIPVIYSLSPQIFIVFDFLY
jgi:hypothetical protein